MIVDLISDLHGYEPELPGGDLLILAGDYTASGHALQWGLFFKWLREQKYSKKILIAGNHDNFIQENWIYPDTDGLNPVEDDVEPPPFEYLCDSGIEFGGLKFWGSPWTHQFPGMNSHCMAFTRPYTFSLEDRWDLIPGDTDILITHGPPHGILDSVKRNNNAPSGDVHLYEQVINRIKPRYHIFGHIHEHGGKKFVYKRPGYGTENNTIFLNVSHLDEDYEPVHSYQRINL